MFSKRNDVSKILEEMNDKQRELYEILLLPIHEAKIEGYEIHENEIVSGFKYGKMFDADMSNIAVRFYSALYNISEEDLLSKEKSFVKGDTMNSSLKYYKTKAEINEKWIRQKHCLANFWILPMDIGRTVKGLSETEVLYCKHSRKSKIFDYMDLFLDFLNNNLDYYFQNHASYFEILKVSKNNFYEDFSSVHCIKCYYTNSEVRLIDKAKLKEDYNDWESLLKKRAVEIATSPRWENVYNSLLTKSI